jgi:hypothetical protein
MGQSIKHATVHLRMHRGREDGVMEELEPMSSMKVGHGRTTDLLNYHNSSL